MAITCFPCVGCTGIRVEGEGLACGFGFAVGAASGFIAGLDELPDGAAFTGPVAGVGILLRDDLALCGWLCDPEGAVLPGTPYA